jgi:hypothetical protein
MHRSTDSAYRGNAISCQFGREHCRRALFKRIGHGRIVLRAGRDHQRLRATDDHHQEFERIDYRDHWPCGHGSINQAVTGRLVRGLPGAAAQRGRVPGAPRQAAASRFQLSVAASKNLSLAASLTAPMPDSIATDYLA